MNVQSTLSLLLIICVFAIVLIALIYHFTKVRDNPGSDRRSSGMQDLMEEKRQHPRDNVNWPASITTPEGTVEAEIKNISLSGAFICCKKPLPLKDVFGLTMRAPGNEPVTATAEVVWSNVNVPDDKVVNRGMGVRFIKMSNKHIQLVKKVLQEG